MTKLYAALAFLLFLNVHLDAQRISLLNPSFEDMPRHSQVPRQWNNCGWGDESPPDTQPNVTFQVAIKPYAGNSYLGMVTRDNSTWEAVGAPLTARLNTETCYKFSIALCASDSYHSISRTTNQPANYVDPTVLRIWGSLDGCSRDELLAQSPPISHKEWQLYTFVLKPEKDVYSNIVLEAFYPDHVIKSTNGNLMLDGASAFTIVPDCNVSAITVAEPRSDPAAVIDPNPASKVGEPAPVEPSSPTSEVVQITGTSNSKRQQRDRLSTPPTNEVITLELPGAAYFKDEATLRSFVSNVLNDLTFTPDHQPAIEQFKLAEEPEARNGHPAWYALQHALQFYPEHSWEMVIYSDIPSNSDLRVLALARQLSTANIRINIVPYDSEIHDGVEWFCMSVGNGLYLLKR